jgi:YcxB-like protein
MANPVARVGVSVLLSGEIFFDTYRQYRRFFLSRYMSAIIKYSVFSLAMIGIELSAIAVLHVTYVVPIIILAVSAFFLAVYELLAFSAWRSSRSEHVGRHWLFEVSDSGIFAKWPRGEFTMSWGAFSTARIHKHSWTFKSLDGRYYLFPRDAFSAEDGARIDVFVRSGIPASGECGVVEMRQHFGVRCGCGADASTAAVRDGEK